MPKLFRKKRRQRIDCRDHSHGSAFHVRYVDSLQNDLLRCLQVIAGNLAERGSGCGISFLKRSEFLAFLVGYAFVGSLKV